MKNIDSTTNLFGFTIYSKDQASLLNFLRFHLQGRKKLLSLFTPNPEQIILSKNNKNFAKYLGFADILIPDGFGLILASRIFSFVGKTDGKGSRKVQKISERITGIDLSRELLKISRQNNYKVLVIGGRDYENREHGSWKVSKDFTDKSINAKEGAGKRNIIWWSEGFNKVENPTDGEVKTIASAILNVKPNIVFVALGAPHQEKWIIENTDILKEANVSIAMAVGGTFDVLFGKINRAPQWMQNLGLEWLYRLVEEPWRWRRQIKLLEFMKLVIKEVLFK